MFDRWVDSWDVEEHDLRIYGVLLGFALVASGPRSLWVTDAPRELLFPPPGFALLMPYPPGAWAVIAANVAIVLGGLGLIFGVRPAFGGFVAFSGMLAAATWSYAFGKINHDILLVLAPLALAFGLGERGDSSRRRDSHLVVACFALAIALAMCTAAESKHGSGWLDPRVSASYFHMVLNHVVTGRSGLMTEAAMASGVPWLWESLDVATVLIEYAFIPALVSPALFRSVAALAVAFHVGVWLTMDIAFGTNLVAYGLTVRWSRVPGLRVLASDTPPWPRSRFVIASVAAAVLMARWLATARGDLNALALQVPLVLLVGSVVAVWLAVNGIREWIASARALTAAARSRVGQRVLLFDGHCGLCNGLVDRLIRRDVARRLRFGALQGEWAQLHHPHDATAAGSDPSAAVLVVGDRVYRGADAALLAIAATGGIATLALGGLLVPRVIRDGVYALVAENRYSVFGRRDTCRLPTEDERPRFVA